MPIFGSVEKMNYFELLYLWDRDSSSDHDLTVIVIATSMGIRTKTRTMLPYDRSSVQGTQSIQFEGLRSQFIKHR